MWGPVLLGRSLPHAMPEDMRLFLGTQHLEHSLAGHKLSVSFSLPTWEREEEESSQGLLGTHTAIPSLRAPPKKADTMGKIQVL